MGRYISAERYVTSVSFSSSIGLNLVIPPGLQEGPDQYAVTLMCNHPRYGCEDMAWDTSSTKVLSEDLQKVTETE
jgi:hypothetical protein